MERNNNEMDFVTLIKIFVSNIKDIEDTINFLLSIKKEILKILKEKINNLGRRMVNNCQFKLKQNGTWNTEFRIPKETYEK